MLMELAKIKELQNSILGRVSEIEQIKRNTAKVTESLETFTNFDDFDAEEEQLKTKINRRKKVIRSYFTLYFILFYFIASGSSEDSNVLSDH